MTKQAFKTANLLRLEVGYPNVVSGLRNLLKNPTGERGAWGWVTPPADASISGSYLSGSTSTDLDGTSTFLTFEAGGPSGVVAYFTSESEPCAPGQYVIAETRLKAAMPAQRAGEISVVFYNASGGVISRAGTVAIPSGSALNSVWRSTAVAAPAGTARVAMRMDALAGTGGVRTLKLDRNSLVVGASAAALTPYAFAVPWLYTNVMLPAFEITTDRAGLTLGTLNARLRDASIDPSINTLLRPGVPVRLMAQTCNTAGALTGTYSPLFIGFLSRASVSYDLTHPDPTKRALISITATDAADRLANLKQNVGVATIGDLRYLVEGCSVPFKVTGTGNHVPGAPVVASRNDNASVLDQIALTRDTTLGHAFVDRYGVLVADTAAGLSPTVQAVLQEADYRHDIAVDYDTARCVNVVTVKRLALDANTPDFIGRPSTVETAFGPYVDQASVLAWGSFAEEFTVNGLSDAAVSTLAASILAANATPKVRCNRVSIPITEARHFADGALAFAPYNASPYDLAGASNNVGIQKRVFVDLYDRVTVLNTRAALTETLRVTGVKHAITPEKWITDLAFASTSGVAMPSKAPDLATGAQFFPDTDWAPLTLINGWTGLGGGVYPLEWRRRNGVSYLRGIVVPTVSWTSVIAVVPVGGRPTNYHRHSAMQGAADGSTQCDVSPTGNINLPLAAPTKHGVAVSYVAMDGCWPAEQ